jgi:hypothetical protein
MAKTWILHTETKGTGAQMVPLERRERRDGPVEPVFVRRTPHPAPESAEPEAPAPRRFRVLDVMTRELLADDVGAGEAVDALRDVRSVVDVNVYVWHSEHDRWRRLTLDEQRAMLDLARAADDFC